MSATATAQPTFWERIGPYDARKNKIALAFFVVLLISYVLNAMDRQVFTVLASDVRKDLNLTVPEVGLASTIFTLGMGVAGLPTGYLMAKVPRKWVSLIGLAVFSLATGLTAVSQGLVDLLLYRFVSGLGEAMQLTALLAIGTTYFLNHRAVAASSLNFTFGIGAILGPNLGAYMANVGTWHTPFLVYAIAGIPIFILIWFVVRSWFTEYHPKKADLPADPPDTPDPVLEAEAAPLVKDPGAPTIYAPTPMVLALATVFAGLSIYGYLGLYATFLREQLGFSQGDAGFAVSMYGLGAMLSLIGGWLGDKFNYNWLLAISLAIAGVTGYFLFTDIRSLATQAVLSFVFGAFISGMVYANLSGGIIKSVQRSQSGTASGLFVAALYIPAAFAGMLIGWLAGMFGWTAAGAIQLGGGALISAALCLVARALDVARAKRQAAELR